MIRHVAAQRGDRDIPLFYCSIVGAVFRIRAEILFADPEVRLTAGIDVFGDNGPGILDPLAGYFDALDHSQRIIHIQEYSLWQAFPHNPSYGEQSKKTGFGKFQVPPSD